MQKNVASRSNIWKSIVGALIVLVILDLTPLGGNLLVYAKVVECSGRVPLMSGVAVLGQVPYYTNTQLFSVLRGTPKYFCTATQAEKAGYSASASEYTYPHLNETESREALSKSRGL